MKWHFFDEDSGKPRINEHLIIYILSLLDPTSQFKASLVNHKWKNMVDLTQKYMSLLPTIHRIPLLSKVGLDVLRLKLMSGGMTNIVYRVQTEHNYSKLLSKISGINPALIESKKPSRWVLRIPGDVSSFSVSRKDEADNARKASILGLNVPIEHIEPDGLQLTKFIEGVQNLDKETLQRVDILHTLAGMAKKLHTSERFENDTAVFDRNEQLLEQLKIKSFVFPEKVDFVIEQMSYLKKLFSSYKIEMCPCHNDSTPLNYMRALDGTKKQEMFYQIDWEYSSNNDFMWDLAYFAIEAKLSKEQELAYLSAYFGKEKLSDSIWAWYNAYKPVVEWWITLWSWTQLANEAKSVSMDEYRNLGIERFAKTLEHLQSKEYKDALTIIEADRLESTFEGHRPF
ncbi:phosphotransferase [Fluoribacter gormanii]|uniref:CTP:phosphocholine cytidylyltransferase involved in choline phosphorylation for cell surface LPS epitopes n=1 Tax=Fluoribacter gormanii TaxID=464 RepID=A0A377GJI0_9GAMM|nr:phosphotransferase [Fluoribacter gormanii]KTD00784.1 choline kinase [Fluoribacter gormanii]SIQ77085.1 Thiamine kinase [Fluoribacter gormanii]STO24931.1 CTP:phosphocholine cytidylyltransferase involved in choline phosphorylation for cell surface LPS epitopes [Fluoribacter gormanii]